MSTLTTTASDSPSPAAQTRDDRTRRLLADAAVAKGSIRRRLLQEVVVINLGVAEGLARRYAGRGQDSDDLVQVASIGLVKAAQRYDPAAGSDFLAYAVPTMTGEIKRHFRDHGWAVRPPRRIQNLQAAIPRITAELGQALRRRPTPAEIADHAGEDHGDVVEAMATRGCYSPTSLDAPGHHEADGGGSIGDLLGEDDAGYSRAEAVALLAPVCRRLPDRDRRILYLRFFRGWTQREIADELGITQMQVSRLIAAIIRRLRAAVGVAVSDEPRTRRSHQRAGAASRTPRPACRARA